MLLFRRIIKICAAFRNFIYEYIITRKIKITTPKRGKTLHCLFDKVYY